jgi:hypothetical protein
MKVQGTTMKNEFVGITLIMLIGAAFGLLVQSFAASPGFVDALRSIHPTLASYATGIGWAALGVVMAITIGLPPILMFKTGPDGNSYMSSLWRGTGLVITAAVAVLWLPSMVYLIGLAWFAAENSITH